MSNANPITLTEREEEIAKRAAELAVDKMTNEFYSLVGRTVIHRLLIIIGAAFVAFLAGKGWLSVE